jgi:RNA polymerase sigma factor (sigma-70 family)
MIGVSTKRAESARSAEPGPERRIGDAELMKALVSANDPAAFAALVERFGNVVWGVCRRILPTNEDAEDAFQAVFLVLAKKGATITNKGAVGSWLYGVAYRTAMKARRDLAHRIQRERKAPPPAPAEGASGVAACRELQRVLDEEVARLPEKFKAPFVLCCIEGLSKSEAARELNWKEGTVSGRLADARKKLQARLIRRGITLSAALTALALTQKSAAAAVSPIVVETTIHGVSGVMAGQTATGLSPVAVSLSDAVVRTFAVAQLKTAGAAILAMALTIASVTVATFPGAQVPAGQAPPAHEAPQAPRRSISFVPPSVPFLEVIDEQVLALAFSADGKQLVTAGGRHINPGQVAFWDVDTQQKTRKARRIPDTRSVAFAPSGKYVACGQFGGAIVLRDPATAQPTATLKGHTIGVNSLAFSDDGHWLVSGGLDRAVKLWDMKTNAEKKAFAGHTDQVYSVAFFHHGKSFVSAGKDKTARIWNVDNTKEKLVLAGHTEPIEGVAVSPDDKVIATASWDSTIKLWDAETAAEIAVLRGHLGAVFAVAFSPDGALLASGSADGDVRLWSTQTRTSIATLGRHGSAVWSVAFSPKGNLLASGGSDTAAKLWDVAERRGVGTLATTEYWPVSALAYSPDGKSVAIATQDKTLEIFDAQMGAKKRVLSGHADVVTCLAFAPDGATLASGSVDKSVRLWDSASGAGKRILTEHTGPVRSLAFSADGAILASAGDDAILHVWDAKSGLLRKALKGHAAPVHAVAFAREGMLLASAGADKGILLWSDDKTEPVRLEQPGQSARVLLFAERALVSGNDDGTLTVWDSLPATGLPDAKAAGRVIKGHARAISSLAYLDRANNLASGGVDGVIMQWDLANGKRRVAFRSHQGPMALAFHPAAAELLSGGADGKVLRLPPADGKPRVAASPPSVGATVKPSPAAPVELKDFYQDFRGSKPPVGPLSLFGVKAERVTRPEDRGLHINVPANPEQTVRIGVELPARFRGDFEITAGYEIVHVDHPKNGHGVGVCLIAELDSPVGEMHEILRSARVSEAHIYGCVRKTLDAAGKEKYQQQWVPTESKAGQIRLVRKGTQLTFWARDGGAAEFEELWQLACGAHDIKHIRFAAYMGFAPNAVDVYLKDLRVTAPGGSPKIASVVATEPAEPPSPHAAARNRWYWMLAIGFMTAFLAAIAVFFLVRRRHGPASGTANHPEAEPTATIAPPTNSAPPATVAFACSDCQKKLRARKSLVGKHVRCPQCGGDVVVPGVVASDGETPLSHGTQRKRDRG